MKKVFFILMMFMATINLSAQEETMKPQWGLEIERVCETANIDGEWYENVIVTLKSADLGNIFTEGVKVTVRDGYTKKKIYSKRFSKGFLYYSTLYNYFMVGRGNALEYAYLTKKDDDWIFKLMEKGIY